MGEPSESPRVNEDVLGTFKRQVFGTTRAPCTKDKGLSKWEPERIVRRDFNRRGHRTVYFDTWLQRLNAVQSVSSHSEVFTLKTGDDERKVYVKCQIIP